MKQSTLRKRLRKLKKDVKVFNDVLPMLEEFVKLRGMTHKQQLTYLKKRDTKAKKNG